MNYEQHNQITILRDIIYCATWHFYDFYVIGAIKFLFHVATYTRLRLRLSESRPTSRRALA